MLNQIVLVGRLVDYPQVKEMEGGKKVSNVTLAIPRSYKNANGEYETDFIDCVLWDSIAHNTSEYCRKGDIVGVKGRAQTRTVEQPDGTKKHIVEVIAEKVTFLSSSRDKEEDYAKDDAKVEQEVKASTKKSNGKKVSL